MKTTKQIIEEIVKEYAPHVGLSDQLEESILRLELEKLVLSAKLDQ